MSSIASLSSALPAVADAAGSSGSTRPGAPRPDEAALPLPLGLRRDSAVISPEARALLERERTLGMPET